jgi:hypothetical protein
MYRVKEINETEHLLLAKNGLTVSTGIGMGDNGGYETVYLSLLSKDDALYAKAKDDSVKIYRISEIQLENVEEYRQYLKLQKKYEGV